jgi:acetyl esterase/lipase
MLCVPGHVCQLARGTLSVLLRKRCIHSAADSLAVAGGAFVAGDAFMYLGTYAYWLHKLAAAGVSCAILSVDYPLAPGELIQMPFLYPCDYVCCE